MSEIGDIITDYRQHTRWNGPQDARVAREVPPEVQRAIEAYEHARGQRREWNERHIRYRDAGWGGKAEDALRKCRDYGCDMDRHWRALAALLPMEPGWYPHAGHIYGYVGMKTGFELKRMVSAWRWPDEARANAYQRGQQEDERGRRQVGEFVASHRGH